MPSPAVASALDRMDRRAGLPTRHPLPVSAEVYGPEQLIRDLTDDVCPVHDCDRETTPHALLCVGHWRLVPADLRREVMEAVRRVGRVASAYDRASGGSGVVDHVNPSSAERRLASEWLEAEDIMREAQLRAVIVASERGGARPA